MVSRALLRGLVFDAYGTSFDADSISVECKSLFPGKEAELSRLWRAKQLEYSWLRSLMGRYAEFETITADVLHAACRMLNLPLRTHWDLTRVRSFPD